METEQPFAVTAALMRHHARELSSPLGVTLTRLCRSDRDRLEFFDGSRIVRNSLIERKFVEGESERVVIEAAQAHPDLRACLGYVSISDRRPDEFAWLLTEDGGIVDPAWSQHRHVHVLGFYGITLRATEVANWVPHDHLRHRVAERDSGRQRLAV